LVSRQQCLLIALWILHTHIFDQRFYMVTPRLLVSSPVRGCGKTTLMLLLESLCANGDRSDNVTAASLYYDMDPFKPTSTFLLDEGDNMDLLGNAIMRAVLNAGYKRGGTIKRYINGRPQRFEVFAPLAIAAIDAMNILPMPLLRRCITVELRRRDPKTEPLQELNTQDPGFLQEKEMMRTRFTRWAAGFKQSKPDIPQLLSDSSRDNWRVLLAIADDLGKGEEARAAALVLSEHQKEDETIDLMTAIRTVFDTFHLDRSWIDEMVKALLEMPDGQWSDWRGPHGDLQPHKLTARELRSVTRSFGVVAHTVYKIGGKEDRGGSKGGWYRSDFETAWASYCPAVETPGEALPKPKKTRPKKKR
jgi:hypothetical protein